MLKLMEAKSILVLFFEMVLLQFGAVAQLGERVNGIHEVEGSIPFSSTKLRFPETHLPILFDFELYN